MPNSDKKNIENITRKYKISSDCSQKELLAVSKVYSREVVRKYELSVEVSKLDWKISVNAKRRAGVVEYCDDTPKAIKLTWEYFKTKGWEAIAETIRHELIHVHLINEGSDSGHGKKFKNLADILDTDIFCDNFTNPAWWVICKDCGGRIPRYRQSKLVKNPHNYECSECGGQFIIEETKGRS